MAARHATYCAICGATLGHLWMGKRHKIPDYTCPKCFEQYETDENGQPIPHSELKPWVKFLKNAEAVQRQRKRYWESRGYQYDAIPFSTFLAERRTSPEINISDEELIERQIDKVGGEYV